MRKLVLSSMLALGLVGILELRAEIRPSIYIAGPEDKQLGILVETDSNELFDIRFIDSNGVILHKEYKVKDYYAKRFDLRQLEPGKYRLEVENESQISTFTINVSGKSVTINSSDKEVVIKPEVNVEGSRINLKVKTSQLPVHVKIFNRYGELIHEESYSGIDSINKVYDVCLHGGGNYRVQVVFNSRSFTEAVAIGW